MPFSKVQNIPKENFLGNWDKKKEKPFAVFTKSCTFALAKAKHWCVSSVG